MTRKLLLLLVFLTPAAFAQFTVPQYTAPGGSAPPPTSAVPAFSPLSSYMFVGGSVSFSLTCSTPSSYMCYTTSGTTPVPNGSGGCTTGTLYASTFAQSTVGTDRAVCAAPGYLSSGTATATITQSSEVLQVDMNNGSGVTATDYATGNNATITAGAGGWSTQAGVANGVYNFDGAATQMNLLNQTNLNFNYTQPFSVFAVVNFAAKTTPNYEVILGTLDTANSFKGWEFDVAYSGSTYFPEFFLINTYGTNGIQVNSNITLNAGTLYDLLVTYDGSHLASGVKIYINGSVVTTSNSSNNLSLATTNAKVPRIGARQDASVPFKGKMGPVKVWNRVITPTEATTLHGNFYAVIN